MGYVVALSVSGTPITFVTCSGMTFTISPPNTQTAGTFSISVYINNGFLNSLLPGSFNVIVTPLLPPFFTVTPLPF